MNSSKKYDVFTVFDACADFILSGGDVRPEFGQKEKLVGGYAVELGGSNVIFASQCAKLGLRATGIGVVGDDLFGHFILSRMADIGIDTSLMIQDKNVKTGVGAALCKDDGDRAMLTYPGSISAVVPEMVSDEMLASTKHLHIGSYYLLENMRKQLPDIAKRAKACGATVSVDTNWDPGGLWGGEIYRLLETADVFLPNENEALLISGERDIESALKQFGETVPVTAVKMGKAGAMAYDGKLYHCAPYDADVMDTVGAGDSFDAGFVYGLIRGYDTQTCLDMGCYCGAMSTRARGGTAKQAGKTEFDKIFIGEANKQ